MANGSAMMVTNLSGVYLCLFASANDEKDLFLYFRKYSFNTGNREESY
jgi:hypothetical protein